MASDDPSVILAEIGDRNEKRIKTLALTDWTVGQQGEGDIRRMRAALDAVLAEHQEAITEPGFCGGCGFTLPCATMRAITSELTGKGNDSG